MEAINERSHCLANRFYACTPLHYVHPHHITFCSLAVTSCKVNTSHLSMTVYFHFLSLFFPDLSLLLGNARFHVSLCHISYGYE